MQRTQAKTHNHIKTALALARECNQSGDIDGYFKHLSEANLHFRSSLDSDGIEKFRNGFAAIKEIFSQEIPSFIVKDPPITPIFILGMPRSGSTLVEQILSSHADVHGAGEIDALNICRDAIKSESGILFIHIRNHYIRRLRALTSGKPYITDKLPGNFAWIGVIRTCLPEAKIIHVNRDPMAVCWSIFKTFFEDPVPYAYDLRTIGQYYNLYQDMMTFWHQKYPGQIYDLSYEALTEDQEGQTRALLEYCGLPWDEACMRFYENDRPVLTASAEQVRRPMYQGSSDDWKRYEKHLGPLKEALGC